MANHFFSNAAGDAGKTVEIVVYAHGDEATASISYGKHIKSFTVADTNNQHGSLVALIQALGALNQPCTVTVKTRQQWILGLVSGEHKTKKFADEYARMVEIVRVGQHTLVANYILS